MKKTRSDKKTSTQRLADKVRSLGIDLSDIDLPTTTLDTEDDRAIEAEAALLYFDLNGEGFTHQVCPVCNQEFAYKYKITMNNMRCSNRCRRADLKARGVTWTPGKSLETRWAKGGTRGNLPLVVPPEALQAVREAMPDVAED